VIPIVCCLKFLIHEINCRGCTPNEKDLHGGVVQGDEAGQEIKISRHKHNQEQDLRLARNSSTTPRFPDLEQQQDNCQEVGQITTQAENIHFLSCRSESSNY